MSIASKLVANKAWQLKYACFLTGLPSTGTKLELADLLESTLDRTSVTSKNGRVISVDMGIRNLATCVLDASSSAANGSETTTVRRSLKVVAWDKIDLLDEVNTASRRNGKSDASSNKPKSLAKAADFSPANLAGVASRLTKDWVQRYNPGHILIERQRFRSGGGTAVQEWTLRVNMLESMLWSSLRTRQESCDAEDSFPHLVEISPRHVAGFWCLSPSAAVRKTPSDLFHNETAGEILWKQVEKQKVEKKDKVAVVRSWLSGTSPSGEVQLEFSDATQEIADIFMAETRRGGRRKNDDVPSRSAEVGKLDDLADCLLQAVAWYRWNENMETIRHLLK